MSLGLKNQFIFAPVKTGYGTGNGQITQKHLDFYALRCEYVGAVTPEPLYLDSRLRELPTQIGIDADDKIDGLMQLTSLFHQYQTKAIAHLNHPGRMANPKIPHNIFLSSTDKACEAGGATPQQMDINDIHDAINLFVNAAQRAEKANFDIIELQFGHGYLVAQFLSPKVNTRDDEYGGSFENRSRLAIEIIDAVKDASSLPIIVRISGDEMLPDGIKLDEMIRFSAVLKEHGASVIHVSSGSICSTPPWYFQHMFVPKGKTWSFAQKIRDAVDIPVVFVGQINEKDDIADLLKDNSKDYIALGRALVADPDFVGKYLNHVKGNIRPCLACSEGCLGGVKSGKGLQCMVNPQVGNELPPITDINRSKKIAVVGGGLAGMEAALMLWKKGHIVTLFEKDKLGGQFNLAYLPPHKQSLQKLIDYYITELKMSSIQLINQAADISAFNDFDDVIWATGSEPHVFPIKGLKEYVWAEVLKKENMPTQKNVVIIGGGLIGTEIANALLAHDNTIHIFDVLPEIATGMEMIEKKLTLKNLNNERVNIYTSSKVLEIENDTVHYEKDSQQGKVDKVDIIVMATGMRSLPQPIAENAEDFNFHVIGDAKKVGKAQDAIRDAYTTAALI